jgi:hypothetical protein
MIYYSIISIENTDSTMYYAHRYVYYSYSNVISVIYIRKQHFRILIRIRYRKFDLDFV